MKLMKETRKLTKEQAELHLDEYYQEYINNKCGNMPCHECIFDKYDTCITYVIEKHATKHNITPEQSYAKWRGILKSIVEGEK